MKIESFLGRIFLSLIATISVLFIIEIASRYFLATRTPIERTFPVQYYRSPKPYSMFGGKPDTQGLNRLGYKGKEPVTPKMEGEFRVFMLGGSTVLQGNPSIPILLEKIFHDNGYHQLQVYNFGVVSSVSSQEVVRILLEISDLDPDLVIMYNGGNDISNPWKWDPRPGYPFNFIVYENNPLLESDLKEYPSIALFAYGSNICRYAFRRSFVKSFVPLEEERKKAKWKSNAWREKIANIYAGNIAKANKISDAFSAGFIAYFQPLIYFKPNLSKEEKGVLDSLEKKDYALDMQKRIRKRISQIKSASPLLFFDLSDAYSDTEEWVFIDSIHTRQETKRVIVKAMFNKVMDTPQIRKRLEEK